MKSIKRLILTTVMAGILLSACTDSKENHKQEQQSDPTDNSQTTERAVAQYYLVKVPSDSAKETLINCYPDLSNKDETEGIISLKDKQLVSLAPGKRSTLVAEGINWLYIITAEKPDNPCYIQTGYLVPAPNQ